MDWYRDMEASSSHHIQKVLVTYSTGRVGGLDAQQGNIRLPPNYELDVLNLKVWRVITLSGRLGT